MKKRFRAAFVFIPVVYAGVILLLLFLQFSDGRRFYETKNGLTLEGQMTPTVEREQSTIASVRLSYNGIAFQFDEDSSLTLASDDGTRSRLAPRAYTTAGEGFRIRFEEGASLRFEIDNEEPNELRVRAELPDGLLPVSSFSIPVSVTAGARLQQASLPGIYPVLFEERTYHLAPPPRARFDTEGGVLELPAEAASQAVRYVRAETPQQDVFTTWFSDDRAWIPEREYRDTVSTYIDEAYLGWTNTRFNGGTGTWEMRSGSPRFSERILTATLAEAWRRDEYTAVFTDMRRAADRHPDQIGLLSAPFLGNLREIRQRFLSADEEQTERLLELASAGNPEVFRTPDLALFARDRGSEELYDSVLELAREADYLEADMLEALGMLQNYYLATFPNGESREVFSRFEAVIEARILPNLYRSEEEGFFLRTTADRIDVFHSLLAGQILIEAGEMRDEQALVSVGRNLVASVLGLSDREGFLPELLYVGADGIENAEGSLGPERVYEVLADNPAYPEEISLSEQIGAGSWVWTVADFATIDIGSEEYVFTLEYPRNRTHYLIMQGIPPFSSMQLFGQQWRDDPSFEAYIKGRHYNRSTETLMIKYTDNSVEGDIILRY